jgi:bacterioferritin
MAGEFVSDVKEIRRRARAHMQQGPVTAGYRADRDTVTRLLNEAEEFAEHAAEEQAHADEIAERITQLGGEPDFNPEGLTGRSHSEYVPGDDLLEMIKEDLVAERIAVESYAEMVRYLGDKDPTTRRMLEEILAKEEEHADDLRNLIERLGGDAKSEAK